MRIDSIQGYNNSFNAKINIIDKYFDNNIYSQLMKKAKSIGADKDIIELNYTNYHDSSCLKTKQNKKISDTLIAKFLPKGEGEGTDVFVQKISGSNFHEFWQKEESAAKIYLNRLCAKYTK